MLDSGWERDVALWLDKFGASFEHHPPPIETPHGRYEPDFVLDDGVIIEVKGRVDYGDGVTQALKLEWLMERGYHVIVVGDDRAREALPYDVFVPHDDLSVLKVLRA